MHSSEKSYASDPSLVTRLSIVVFSQTELGAKLLTHDLVFRL
jgi:hypothetical protein